MTQGSGVREVYTHPRARLLAPPSEQLCEVWNLRHRGRDPDCEQKSNPIKFHDTDRPGKMLAQRSRTDRIEIYQKWIHP